MYRGLNLERLLAEVHSCFGVSRRFRVWPNVPRVLPKPQRDKACVSQNISKGSPQRRQGKLASAENRGLHGSLMNAFEN